MSVSDSPCKSPLAVASSDVGCLGVAIPPDLREGEPYELPMHLSGPLIQLGPLLIQWLSQHGLTSSKHEPFDSSKHHSTAEVFPLPMPAVDLSAFLPSWLEATVRALNWLAVGALCLGEGPCTVAQESLLSELVSSLGILNSLSAEHFDPAPIESYWKSRSVNGYGKEVHSALLCVC